MTILPNNITRYTGANSFTAEDSAGNIFVAFQKQNDAGSVVMFRPDGLTKEVLSIPSGGRPSLDCNPFVNLWAVGNKEVPTNEPPRRYPIKEYVPWPKGVGAQGEPGPQGPQGEPGVGGLTLFPSPYISTVWSGRQLSGGVIVDIPATFGVASASTYLVRLSGMATTAGVIVRAGTEIAPYFLTLVTQAPNVRMDTQGWIPGPVALVSCVGLAQVWMQVIGM